MNEALTEVAVAGPAQAVGPGLKLTFFLAKQGAAGPKALLFTAPIPPAQLRPYALFYRALYEGMLRGDYDAGLRLLARCRDSVAEGIRLHLEGACRLRRLAANRADRLAEIDRVVTALRRAVAAPSYFHVRTVGWILIAQGDVILARDIEGRPNPGEKDRIRAKRLRREAGESLVLAASKGRRSPAVRDAILKIATDELKDDAITEELRSLLRDVR